MSVKALTHQPEDFLFHQDFSPHADNQTAREIAMKNKLKLILTVLTFAVSVTVQAYEDYDWASVPIGGGGYTTGMKIHPLNG